MGPLGHLESNCKLQSEANKILYPVVGKIKDSLHTSPWLSSLAEFTMAAPINWSEKLPMRGVKISNPTWVVRKLFFIPNVWPTSALER